MKAVSHLKTWLIPIILLLVCIPASGQSPPKRTKIQRLIAKLYKHRWQEPQNVMNPTLWEFGFTRPMLKILELGPEAQDELLKYLSDPRIKDQVIILLGGVGDERAVGPIINAMVSPDEFHATPNAKHINLSANLALTNITVADVIWHHGGGIMVDRCSEEISKRCWAEWWKKNQSTFTVKGITQSRNYSNYPNYGIYKQR